MINCPRVIIAGTGGDCGKTLVTLSLALHWCWRGFKVSAFKKGPDFIDSAWLGWATGSPARNLDTYIVPPEKVREAFFVHACKSDIALIEGNRGLYDGFDAQGTHSTAQLAKLITSPVILVVNAAKSTRTVAAVVLGCMKLDPEVKISGVILNRVSGQRHRSILSEAVESICGIPVLGYIPPLEGKLELPSRHLGLVPPAEYAHSAELKKLLLNLAQKHLFLNRIWDIAGSAEPEMMEFAPSEPVPKMKNRVKIGYFSDSAFTFYYPENLEALEAEGAELLPISSISTERLPDIDALFIGGGFPETHLKKICENVSLLRSVKSAVEAGLPIYAECGGFIYLAQSLRWGPEEYPLADVFPLKLIIESKPQGHGYYRVKVDGENPFFPLGTILKGHEFHYSKVISGQELVKTAYSVERGTGCFQGRDGVVYKNVLASYLHLHASGTPSWAENFVSAAALRAGHLI